MTWSQAHERAQLLEALLAQADSHPDGLLPDLSCSVPAGVFASAEELLLAVFQRWQRRLLTRLDVVVEREDGASCADVAAEVAQLARQAPGMSAIVAAQLDSPALSSAWHRCAELVGMATGLPMQVELAGQLRGAVARASEAAA
jgi:hypothetical protein